MFEMKTCVNLYFLHYLGHLKAGYTPFIDASCHRLRHFHWPCYDFWRVDSQKVYQAHAFYIWYILIFSPWTLPWHFFATKKTRVSLMVFVPVKTKTDPSLWTTGRKKVHNLQNPYLNYSKFDSTRPFLFVLRWIYIYIVHTICEWEKSVACSRGMMDRLLINVRKKKLQTTWNPLEKKTLPANNNGATNKILHFSTDCRDICLVNRFDR